MLLKLILILIVVAVVYRFLGGNIPFIDRKKKSQKEDHEFGKIEATSECARCSTYMTEEDAIIYHKKAYCSNECLQQALKK